MPRKAGTHRKPLTGQYSSKVYWSNGDEELDVRIRAQSMGKNISRYIRDLVMLDLDQFRHRRASEDITTKFPLGLKPGDEITFFEEPIKPITPEEDAAEFKRLLQESEEEDLDL